MANIKSAQKRIRQDAKRTARNTARRSRMRTYVKRVETAIESGDQTANRPGKGTAQLMAAWTVAVRES